MTFNKPILANVLSGLAVLFACNACFINIAGTSTSTQSGSTSGPTPITVTAIGPNVMTVTVNGSLCGNSSYQYPNEPCASVTICDPGTTNCQTIDNILVDTGSFGLRIFQSVITVPLVPVTQGSGTLAECVQYGDGSSQWGAVEYADVKLGEEPAVQVPIEVIDPNYATAPGPCTSAQSTPDTGPTEAGFNGILGVGLLVQDCGDYCAPSTTADNSGNGQYYLCTGSTCTGATASLATQVSNPVASLPVDNNGVVMQLPAVPDGGAFEANGYMILGIGTEANNTPSSGVTTFTADGAVQEFTTVFGAYSSAAIPSFIDSGSSILFIPSTSVLPDCSTAQGGSYSDLQGFYCPSATQDLTAVNYAYTGSVSGNVSFEIANTYDLINTGFSVFSNLGGLSATGSNAYFDWGLPFFYGRNVYVGFEGTSSSLGSGPYWAY